MFFQYAENEHVPLARFEATAKLVHEAGCLALTDLLQGIERRAPHVGVDFIVAVPVALAAMVLGDTVRDRVDPSAEEGASLEGGELLVDDEEDVLKRIVDRLFAHAQTDEGAPNAVGVFVEDRAKSALRVIRGGRMRALERPLEEGGPIGRKIGHRSILSVSSAANPSVAHEKSGGCM